MREESQAPTQAAGIDVPAHQVLRGRREQGADRRHVPEELGDVTDSGWLQDRERLCDMEPREIEPAHEEELPAEGLGVAAIEQLDDAPAALDQPDDALAALADLALERVDRAGLVGYFVEVEVFHRTRRVLSSWC